MPNAYVYQQFQEFEDSRDAEDAMHELNGRDMSGSRVVVERCRRREDTYRARDSRDSRDSHYDSRSSRSKPMTRYGPPVQTRYRLTVENLSTRCSWQVSKFYFSLYQKHRVGKVDDFKA